MLAENIVEVSLGFPFKYGQNRPKDFVLHERMPDVDVGDKCRLNISGGPVMTSAVDFALI